MLESTWLSLAVSFAVGQPFGRDTVSGMVGTCAGLTAARGAVGGAVVGGEVSSATVVSAAQQISAAASRRGSMRRSRGRWSGITGGRDYRAARKAVARAAQSR